MMLVYNLPERARAVPALRRGRRLGYLVGGFGMTAVVSDRIIVVPIRSGVGARLGINVGYLKFTREAT